MFIAATLTAGPSPAVPGCAPPPVTPESDLHPGTTGTALTVVQGRIPVSFDIQVLGIQTNGIGPGLDLILVQASGPVIDQTGGIAFGMSGSPVYVNGRLAGAIAYSSGGDPTIAGLTPAQAMVDILSYPQSSKASSLEHAFRATHTIVLDPGLRRSAARQTGTKLADVPTTVRQLDLPLAVSGLSSLRLQQFRQRVAERALPLLPYSASSVPAPTSLSTTPLVPGDSFAAVLSYGDVTSGSIGTATLTCGAAVIAFGHPLFFDGKTLLGYNGADVITVVKDPGLVSGGPFKLANIAEPHGVVDQDRLAGLRGIEGQLPRITRVTSDVTGTDLGKARSGESDVVRPEMLGSIASLHVESNLDAVFDRVGDGSLRLNWTIQGTRQNGDPFTVNRADMWYSPYDASVTGAFEIGDEANFLLFNGSEQVTIDRIDVTGSITQARLEATINRVLTGSTTQPGLKQRSELKVRPGDTVHVRAFLLPLGSDTEQRVDLELRVPRSASGSGALIVRGGLPLQLCGYYCYGPSPIVGDGFDQILDQLNAAESSFDLVAQLFPKNPSTTQNAVSAQADIVQGKFKIRVEVVG